MSGSHTCINQKKLKLNTSQINENTVVCVIIQVFIDLIKHHDKKQLVEEMFISSYRLRRTIEERQGRNLEAWTDTEAIGEYSFTGLLFLALLTTILKCSSINLLGVMIPTIPIDLPTVQSYRSILSIVIPSSQLIIVHVKLKEN